MKHATAHACGAHNMLGSIVLLYIYTVVQSLKIILNYTNLDFSNPVVDNLNRWFTQYSCLK
jgi:hypothetical protein